MAIICWGNLAKSADSTQKIEQAIMGYIETHDENPNAHMGPDYALGAHRLQVELDHLPYSVLNKYLYPQSRTYKAVVDPAGNGDVTTIQAGIDYVHSIGGGSLLIKAGTYIIGADITLYSDIELIGEDDETTILDFNDASFEIIAHGTSGTHLHNIHISNLQFKDMSPAEESGDYLFDFLYTDDSSIKSCRFVNIKGLNDDAVCICVDYCERIKIKDNRFEEPGDKAILLEATSSYCQINDNYFEGDFTNDCIDVLGDHNTASGNISYNVFGPSIVIAGDYNTIIGNTSKNTLIQAIYCTGDHNTIVGNTINATASSSTGIDIDGGKYNTVNCNAIGDYSDTGGEAIEARNDADYNTIVGNTISNCETGILIYNDTCNGNTVVANAINGCDTDITDNGTGTEVAHNT